MHLVVLNAIAFIHYLSVFRVVFAAQ